jgi:phosphatidylglycerol:prolipoprotein diacylglycerol transferase
MYSHFDTSGWVTPFGLIFIMAIASAWAYGRRNARLIGVDGSHIDLLVPASLIVGIAGAKAFAVLMPLDQMLAGELMNVGARVRLFPMLAAGAGALFVYSRCVKLPFRSLLDVFALPTLVALMIHRFGCFLAGCCWGDVVSEQSVSALSTQIQTLPAISKLVSGVHYPPGSLPYEQHLTLGLIESGSPLSLAVMPVQLYEAFLLLMLFALLRRFPWREYSRGALAVLVTSTYAGLRFLIEYLRADGFVVVGNLNLVQLQCLLLLSLTILLPGMLEKRQKAMPG